MKMRIAIADDHPLVQKGLQAMLADNADMEVSGCYSNGKELLAGIAKDRPDVLLLDIQMPGQTGDELAEIIKKKYPGIKMIALTNQDNIYYIKTMFRKGVDGYVLKTTGEEILLDAIRTVNEGAQYIEPALKEKLAQDNLQNKKLRSNEPVLSRREKEVLQYLAKNMTSQQIADEMNISKRTIDSHRMSLLIKLDVKNVAALIKKAMQMGLIE